MSIQTYAVLDNLPAPVTSGSGIQSFTDVLGDVWVAANGVYGGAWKRARDVLVGAWHRVGAWSTGTATTLMTYDSMDYDTYGLYNQSNGTITLPVAGIWRIDHVVAASMTATAQWVQTRIDVSGQAGAGYGLAMASGVTWIVAPSWVQRKMNAGDQVILYQAASVVLTGRVDIGNTKMSFAYLGTG
jgi:hypothetical protein